MTEHAVVIAGGGPTGLMLAAELTIAGVDVLVIERRATREFEGARAGGLHARTLEVLDQRGVADRFLAAGQTHPVVGFAYIPLDVSDLPTRHPYVLALWQRESERILAEWVLGELGVPVLHGREVVGLRQDGDAVEVEVSGGPPLRARYLVGCDGGRSTVRRAAGIDFPGLDPSTSFVMAEVEMAEQPPLGVRPEGGGIGPVDRDGLPAFGVVVRERRADHDGEPTMEDLRSALVATYGSDFGVHNPTKVARFTDVSRQAAAYRAGRVLLAGDVAHVHPPHGGQGLNTGVQDAVNLGWKLARVVHGSSPDSLLDTYHDERHPVGARLLRNTEAQVALTTHDDRHPALTSIVAELLGLDEARRRIASMITGLDVAYHSGDGHPLVGRRVPDLDLRTSGGAARVSTLLHDAQPLLLDLTGDGGFDASAWPGVRCVAATAEGSWELPVLGEVPAPAAVLVRPDGHAAWAGELDDPTLHDALGRWFGATGAP